MTKPRDVLYEKAEAAAIKRKIAPEKRGAFIFGYIEGFLEGKGVEVIPYDTSWLFDKKDDENG